MIDGKYPSCCGESSADHLNNSNKRFCLTTMRMRSLFFRRWTATAFVAGSLLFLPHYSALFLSRIPTCLPKHYPSAIVMIRHSSLFYATTTTTTAARPCPSRSTSSVTSLAMVPGGGGRRGGRHGGGGGAGGGGRRRPPRQRRPRAPAPPIPLPGQPGRGCFRELVQVGKDVYVIKKEDQRSGVETLGTVARHLTNSPYHPRGIKVMLTSGQVGRITRFVDDE